MNMRSILWLLVAGLVALAAVWKFSRPSKPVKPAEPAPGSVWTEPGTGMPFVWVPSGCFDMGSKNGKADELPVHQVCLDGFYLGKYEVTQTEYEQVVGDNPSARYPNYAGPDRAVTDVTWDAANDMAAGLSQKSSNQFRLPSEAEWEYACRAGGKHPTYCGDGDLGDLAWVTHPLDSRKDSDPSQRPQTVGGKNPNAWGLYDMNGNVGEWTEDCWHPNYEGAPKNGGAWLAGGDCYKRVDRGGSWSSSGRIDATRRGYIPIDETELRFVGTGGFRLVRTVASGKPIEPSQIQDPVQYKLYPPSKFDQQMPVPKAVFFDLTKEKALLRCVKPPKGSPHSSSQCRQTVEERHPACVQTTGSGAPDPVTEKDDFINLTRIYLHCVTPEYFCDGKAFYSREEADRECPSEAEKL